MAAAVTTSNAAVPPTEAGAVAAAAAALPARDEGDNGSTSSSTRVPPFLTKLYTIVQQPQPDDHVGWCDDGASFRVSDPVKFAARVLPRHFKHNKLGSFQQQLLTYGFQRLPNQVRVIRVRVRVGVRVRPNPNPNPNTNLNPNPNPKP